MQTDSLFASDTTEHVESVGPLRALDELFLVAQQFSTRTEYKDLLEFIARFRMYSPFNAMLVRTQMPGARYVAPPNRWRDLYMRTIRPGARPITILQPKGPVLFVFDVSDTEPLPGAPPLPQSVVDPFAIVRGQEKGELAKTIMNAERDGVRIHEREFGSQQAGQIQTASGGQVLQITVRKLFKQLTVTVPVRYELLLNAKQTRESRYATLVHELGHLYCGHLGSPNEQFWPNRRGLSREVEECEAESISYIVCTRLGIETNSARYVAGYLSERGKMPPISLDTVMKAAGLIVQMGQEKLPLRKDNKE